MLQFMRKPNAPRLGFRFAPGADGIGFSSLRRQSVFDADLVAPGDVQTEPNTGVRGAVMSDGKIPAGGYQRRVERISQAVVRVRVRGGRPPFEGVQALILDWLREKAGQGLSDTMLCGETDS